MDFVQIPFNECCDCPAGVSGPTTDVTSVVNFIVVANCQDHPVRFVRHVGYTAAGIPIVAQSRDCAGTWPTTTPAP